MNRIINLNKPAGITSHEAVAKVKRILGIKKAGHTGTLDPMASGILLVCLNEATKIARFILDMDKEYRARVRLGERTDTFDSRGKILERKDVPSLSRAQILDVVKTFEGRIMQVPPMYSAIKIGGEPLYKLARRGIDVARPPREIEIHKIEVLDIDMPFFDLAISCSKGTYIRTLCEDIGLKIGCGAHMAALERVKVGLFDLKESVTFSELEANNVTYKKHDYSIEDVLAGLKQIILGPDEYQRAKNGMQIALNGPCSFQENEFIMLKNPSEKLFGIGRMHDNNILIDRILHL